ncbi:hypothetical protein [Streptomyces sp. E5N91]|uniref:hypothetical protein n=1 Tax=Streptomyces sp. E5N91 TaxID=1851996 RepID=UPI000EF5FF7C|nr:hypothetical protein [Streptomyces sp. E5N91]
MTFRRQELIKPGTEGVRAASTLLTSGLMEATLGCTGLRAASADRLAGPLISGCVAVGVDAVGVAVSLLPVLVLAAVVLVRLLLRRGRRRPPWA